VTGSEHSEAANREDRGILQVKASERRERAHPDPGERREDAHTEPGQRREDAHTEPGQRREYTLWGRRTPPIPSFTGLVEPAEAGKIGIACSGGGIRSAAFSLGALQVLQEEKKLQRASYLAGVSGGSYIAAAFSMVRRTWPRGKERPDEVDDPDDVDDSDNSDPSVVDPTHPPFFPGSPEEQYLRNRSSYMAAGAFGKIQFGYRLLLGMGVNMLFIAFAVITLALPLGLLYGAIYPSLTAHVGARGLCGVSAGGQASAAALCHFVPLHIPTALWVAPTALAGASIVLAGTSLLAYRWRGWFTEAVQIWSLRLLLVSGIFAFLFIAMPVLLSLIRDLGAATGVPAAKPPTGVREAAPVAALAGAGGGLTLAGAVLLQLRADWSEAKVLVGQVSKAREWWMKLSQRLRLLTAYAIAALIGPALMLLIALAAMTILLNLQHAWEPWAIVAAFALAFATAYSVADMTTWSLHSFYRRRLCSAFALKRVARGEGYPPIAAVEAGMAVERDYHHLVQLSQTAVPEEEGCEPWPTLLVCASANISDTSATPPGRAVTSFTFSAHAIGGPLVGAVPTADLERSCDETRKSYFTLPAAVAMSGAAISPSMGKMTRWPLRFLMGLANIRLGVWVPNPRRMHVFEQAARRPRRVGSPYPLPRASYLLRELLGMNSIDSKYLYVTDGGHYENLGLVELLRRGCTEVYVFDASNDDFGAIGDAVSLARSELEVEVEVDYSALKPDKESGISSSDCVEAPIAFPVGPDGQTVKGTLYYARLTMTAKSPTDTQAYAAQDRRFPHDPTTDQLYTDQRFEAYRSLGAQAAHTALGLEVSSRPAS
jgi:hypothetical protein